MKQIMKNIGLLMVITLLVGSLVGCSSEEEKRPTVKVAPKEGDNFTNSLGMKFVFIEPGTFMMGSPISESQRGSDETQHQVMLTKGYWMQTTEVTQGQWKAVMGSTPSSSKRDDLPVEMVSWDDVQDFIIKLNQRGDKITYNLPTEAQWEYAARAGSSSRYCFGDSENELENYAWYFNSSGEADSVGQKLPNAWGLYDMYGLVSEWCQDWSGDYPSDSVTDPTGPSTGSFRVTRGGNWGLEARYCRSASRSTWHADKGAIGIGFRLAAAK